MAEEFKRLGGFWLVDTIVDVSVDLPVDIVPNVRFERATDNQIDILKSRVRVGSFEDAISVHREHKSVITSKTATATAWGPEALPRDKWRYFLFTYSGNGNEFHGINKLCSIVDPPFEFRFAVHTRGEYGTGEAVGWGGQMVSPLSMFKWHNESVPVITQDTIDDLRDAHTHFHQHKATYPDINRAVDLLHDVRLVPHNADLYVLGLFAVIELLLTHNPQDKENADSLSHQLSTKIPLIDKRLPSKIDYSAVPASPPSDRLWKMLYAYRSAIAHGDKPDFDHRFRVLKSHDLVRDFVHQACRKLLRHALREPVLFRDLKKV